MGYYDFPHTRNYDTDLGYLIKRYFELSTDFESLEKNFNDLKAWCIAQLNSEALKTLVANKLDEWLADGTLEALINNPLNHVTTYDTIVEMITHSALIEGSKIYCAGADTVNDGKGGHFRIRARLSTDVIDNYNLYLIDGGVKVAERIKSEIKNKTKLAIYGDSWVDSTLPYYHWCEYVATLLNADLHFIGTAGAKLNQVVNSFDSFNADIYIFEGGINDCDQGQSPLDTRDAVYRAINNVRAINPNAEIYFMTPTAQIEVPVTSSSGAVKYLPIEVYRQAIWTGVNLFGGLIIDGLKINNLTLTDDGYHPADDNSLRIIAKAVYNSILRKGDDRNYQTVLREIPNNGYLLVNNGNCYYNYNASLTYVNGSAPVLTDIVTNYSESIVVQSVNVISPNGGLHAGYLGSDGRIDLLDSSINGTVSVQYNLVHFMFIPKGLK